MSTQSLVVEIVRWVHDDQPGWVAAEFVDSAGECHTIIDKVAIFTEEHLDAASGYPQRGRLECEVLKRWRDASGRELTQVSIAHPFCRESTKKITEFVVLSSQLAAIH